MKNHLTVQLLWKYEQSCSWVYNSVRKFCWTGAKLCWSWLGSLLLLCLDSRDGTNWSGRSSCMWLVVVWLQLGHWDITVSCVSPSGLTWICSHCSKTKSESRGISEISEGWDCSSFLFEVTTRPVQRVLMHTAFLQSIPPPRRVPWRRIVWSLQICLWKNL